MLSKTEPLYDVSNDIYLEATSGWYNDQWKVTILELVRYEQYHLIDNFQEHHIQ